MLSNSANENLFEISKYKNYYTNRIDKSNSALLKNELEEIYKKAFMLYEYSVKELKDHKDKREVFIGNDGVSQIIESTALFIVRETRINTVFYNCDANDSLFKTFTKDGNTKQCKNETLVNFCVQLLQFIDLTGVLEKVQIDNNKQNPPQQTENSKPDGVLLTNENIDIFKLDELYKQHKDIVVDLLMKKTYYPKSYIEELENNFGFTKDDIYRYLLNNYQKEEDLHKRPLSKLIKDISEELDLI